MLKLRVQTALKPILCVDFGYRHLGIAVSDKNQKMAMALTQLHMSPKQAVSEIKKLYENYKIGEILVGMPTPSISEHTELTKDVEQFINILKTNITENINTFNELLSSKLAGNVKNNHAEAARIILQGYLDTLNEPKLKLEGDQISEDIKQD